MIDDDFDALDTWAEQNSDHCCLMCGGQFDDLDEWYDATDGVCDGCVAHVPEPETVTVELPGFTIVWPM